MAGQNILKKNGFKIDIVLDNSELYDFYLIEEQFIDLKLDVSENFDMAVDKTDWVDLILDYSEYYDCQLDYSPEIEEYEIEMLYKITEFGCDYTILTQDQFSILTQNEECIQYQY